MPWKCDSCPTDEQELTSVPCLIGSVGKTVLFSIYNKALLTWHQGVTADHMT